MDTILGVFWFTLLSERREIIADIFFGVRRYVRTVKGLGCLFGVLAKHLVIRRADRAYRAHSRPSGFGPLGRAVTDASADRVAGLLGRGKANRALLRSSPLARYIDSVSVRIASLPGLCGRCTTYAITRRVASHALTTTDPDWPANLALTRTLRAVDDPPAWPVLDFPAPGPPWEPPAPPEVLPAPDFALCWVVAFPLPD